MFLKGAIRSGTKGRRAAMFAAGMVAVLSVPAMMYGFDPPAYLPDLAQAQVHGCANCHGTFSGTSGISVTGVPANYKTGSTTPVNMTVSLPGGQGFYLAILDSASANAGMITAGTGSQVTAVGGVNFLIDSTSGTSWSFTWTPGTATGTVGVYVAGGTHGTSYATSYMIPAASTAPTTLTLAPSGTLTFNATAPGADPTAQSVMVTASGGTTTEAFTATPTSTGNWLTVGGAAAAASGTTPVSESIGVVTAGLTPGKTYSGTVQFSANGVSNSPLTLNVTLRIASTTGGAGAETFDITVVDRQSLGADFLLLDGSGSVDTNNTPTGSGNFTRFRSQARSSRGTGTTIVYTGPWKPTSVTSNTSGCLVMQVQLTATPPGGGSSTLYTGTLRISDPGSSSGASLAITPGSTTTTGSATTAASTTTTFNSVGIGSASLGTPGTGCSSTGGGPPPPPVTDE
jgi:hypothetical protein